MLVEKKIVRKNPVHKNGQKGTSVDFQLFLDFMSIQIPITLPTRYHKNIHIKLQFIPKISQIIIQILKSPHHKALPPDKNICKKKNINIKQAHIIQLKIEFSEKLVSGKVVLQKKSKNQTKIKIQISQISFNHFSIIMYKNHKINIPNAQLENISIKAKFCFPKTKVFIVQKLFRNNQVKAVKIQTAIIHSWISVKSKS